MALKEGDTVTLSVGFPIKIAEYEYLKPHASVNRKLSDDLAGDLDSMEAGLRDAVYRSSLVSITMMNELIEKLDEFDGDLDKLAAYCAEQAGVTHESQIEVEGGEAKAPVKKVKQGSLKKGPKKKVKAGAGSLAKHKGPKRKKITG